MVIGITCWLPKQQNKKQNKKKPLPMQSVKFFRFQFNLTSDTLQNLIKLLLIRGVKFLWNLSPLWLQFLMQIQKMKKNWRKILKIILPSALKFTHKYKWVSGILHPCFLEKIPPCHTYLKMKSPFWPDYHTVRLGFSNYWKNFWQNT